MTTALEQVEWQRYHEGSYSNSDPLLTVKDKLKDRKELNLIDIQTLINITDRSIKYLGKYDYGSDVDSEKLRQDAMQPLFNLRDELIEMREALND
jgi:hypothetical protein